MNFREKIAVSNVLKKINRNFHPFSSDGTTSSLKKNKISKTLQLKKNSRNFGSIVSVRNEGNKAKSLGAKNLNRMKDGINMKLAQKLVFSVVL